jgi:hypothetical protein
MKTGRFTVANLQLLSQCGYAQRKRLPTEMELNLIFQEDLSSEPLLKHVETTVENGRRSEKYVLLEQVVGRFGRMQVFRFGRMQVF